MGGKIEKTKNSQSTCTNLGISNSFLVTEMYLHPCHIFSTQMYLLGIFVDPLLAVQRFRSTQQSGCPGEKSTRTVAGGPIWQSDRVIPRVAGAGCSVEKGLNK